MSTALDTPSGTRASLLLILKEHGPVSATRAAAQLGISREGTRQHLSALEEEGWVRRRSASPSGRSGRPSIRYELTVAGEHLFPKNYDGLTLNLMDAVTEHAGERGLKQLLRTITDRQVAQWEKSMTGKSLHEKVIALKGIYFETDPFTSVETDQAGLKLIERNCPFLNLALERPQLCSVTLSTLSRLLGVRVVREARFQRGDGRCVFRVLADEPIDPATFHFEYEQDD